MKNISESIFETVYGKNNIAFSMDLAYRTRGVLEIFLHTDYFSADGKLQFDPKNTNLKIIPLEFGFRAVFGKSNILKRSKINPYIGVGAGYYMLKEDNFIGSVNEKKFGFFGEGGLRFNFGKKIFLDLKIKFIQLKFLVDTESRNLGGLAYFGGIGYRF